MMKSLAILLLIPLDAHAAVQLSHFSVTPSKVKVTPMAQRPITTAVTTGCPASAPVRVNLTIDGKPTSACVLSGKLRYTAGVLTGTAQSLPDPLFKAGFERVK